MRLLKLLLILGFQISHAEETIKICDHVFLEEGNVTLNKNEEVLVCGSDRGGQGWESVPLTQAEFHLRAILQNLGYQQPRFQRVKDQLFVWSGPKRQIKKLYVDDPSDTLSATQKRKVVGAILTPEKLNEIEAWANLGVRSNGFACPKVQVVAQMWNDTVVVKTNVGEKKTIASFVAPDLEGLSNDALDRYRPFELGDIYDIRETQIMTSRMVTDGLFQSAFFETSCTQFEANLDLKTSIGKPRIVRFGIGGSTEELPFLDFTLRNTRLDDKASSATATLHLSPRLLRFIADSKLYWFPGWSRTFFGPRFRMTREIESAYQTDSGRLGADIGRDWDMWDVRFIGRAGPTLNYVRTTRGIGPADSKYPTLDASLNLMNDVYESSMWQQYEGWTANLSFRGQGRGLGSQVNVYRYEVDFKHLWNIGDYDPPLGVLGTRIEGTTVDATDINNRSTPTLIPIEDRVFVGGDRNLRGFPRKGLNNQGLGYLTFLYLGFELRLIEMLPYHLQPFLLLDRGLLGTQRYTLDPPVFASDGVGLRWLSPLGTVRSTIAKGSVSNLKGFRPSSLGQWVFFFSFGQEF